ncbi:MAG: hypothetical protein L3J42_06965, partial [Hydrogenimonas sp.]|nr:hypothetical protein [Hydrogenimonas sp.]
ILGAELEIWHKIDSFESIVWQSELLYKNQDSYDRNIDQAGYYSQIVYKKERFGFGVRYDRIYKNRDSLPENLYRTTVMSEYRFSQYSRLRLQYSHDRSLIVDGERKSVNQLILSLNISAGAHKEEPF